MSNNIESQQPESNQFNQIADSHKIFARASLFLLGASIILAPDRVSSVAFFSYFLGVFVAHARSAWANMDLSSKVGFIDEASLHFAAIKSDIDSIVFPLACSLILPAIVDIRPENQLFLGMFLGGLTLAGSVELFADKLRYTRLNR